MYQLEALFLAWEVTWGPGQPCLSQALPRVENQLKGDDLTEDTNQGILVGDASQDPIKMP